MNVPREGKLRGYNDGSPMNLLYSAGLALALLLTSPYWLLQMLRSGKYRAGLAERFGKMRLRAASLHTIWVHAVSVGEVLAAAGVVAALRERYTGHRVVVSTTTRTGQELARKRFGEESVFYFPLDFAFAIRPCLRALKPEMIVLMETEFWPNFLRLAKASGARIAVANARISDRSLPRYRRLRRLMRTSLATIDVFLAQTKEDARRLVEIGADAARVRVSGNLKFDIPPAKEAAIVAELRGALARASGGPVLVFGSTVEGEEKPLIEAFRAVLGAYAHAVLILAPRHPERFAAVAELLGTSGISWWRRSQGVPQEMRGGIFLLDSIGELAAVYALAQIAFVGGSLAARGGHNILEPAQHGAPILVGEHTENFREIVSLFQAADALCVVSEDDLAAALLHLLANPDEAAGLGRRGREVLAAHSGATQRTLAALDELMKAPR